MLDATYKTSRLNLPLFFMAVKTNCGYLPVCSFVTQHEDADSIAGALAIIKRVLEEDGIKLSNFMVDKSSAELKAIRTIFPGRLMSIGCLCCSLLLFRNKVISTKCTYRCNYSTL